MSTGQTPPGIWTGQKFHFACLASLLILVLMAWKSLGTPSAAVFWMAIACPILHQMFVWLAWRFELRSGATSRTLGFHKYLICFFILFASRFVSLFALAWMDSGSLKLGVVSRTVLATFLILPGAYAGYSVQRYFGMARAAGADHFNPRYRQLPLVRAGIFQFTNNGMYIYAFLLFWAMAVGFNSSAALTTAAFSHVYIWVHFYATEKPDMDYLYAGRGVPPGDSATRIG